MICPAKSTTSEIRPALVTPSRASNTTVQPAIIGSGLKNDRAGLSCGGGSIASFQRVGQLRHHEEA